MRIIAGTHKNQQIISPKGMETRPTSGKLRGSLFNICQGYIQDAQMLDLFAGSGAIGLEALSRGASHVTFIDSSKESIHCIHQNLKNMGFLARAQVICGDVFQWMEKLEKLGRLYEIIYADPPYGKIGNGDVFYSQEVINRIDRGGLLLPDGDLFVEESNGLKLQGEGLGSLELVSSRNMGKAILQQYRKRVMYDD